MASEIEQLTEALNETRKALVKAHSQMILLSVAHDITREFLVNHVVEVTGESAEELFGELDKLTSERYEATMLKIEDENPAAAAHLHLPLKNDENK